ncbi:hypothetical protein J3R83DRAFT_7895, partial [Lanmaoa asiatica]
RFTAPVVAALFTAGKELLPPGFTEKDNTQLLQAKTHKEWLPFCMESCAAKTIIASTGGEGVQHLELIIILYFVIPLRSVGLSICAFSSPMLTSFAYEDPYLRAQSHAGVRNTHKAREIFKNIEQGCGKVGEDLGKLECSLQASNVSSKWQVARVNAWNGY